MKIISLATIIVGIVVCGALPAVQIEELLDVTPEPVPEIAFNAERDIRFLVFTRQNPTVSQQLLFRDLNSLRNTNYNANLPTRFIIHGFQSDSSADVNILLTAGYLRQADVNVVVGKNRIKIIWL